MDESTRAALRNNPLQEITLYPSRTKWILLSVVCGLFALLGFVIGVTGDAHGWIVAAIFGSLTAYSIWHLNSRSNYLRLTPTGFEVRAPMRKYDVRWNEIADFGAVIWRRNLFVVFNFNNPTSGDAKRRAQNRRVLSYDEMIPETYGLSVEELAEILELRRRAAISAA